MDKNICKNPWNFLRIEVGGYCFFCCSTFVKDYHYIGKITENNFDEVWNGQAAQEYRQDVLDKRYTYCDLKSCEMCYSCYEPYYRESQESPLLAKSPTVISLAYDYSCAQKCAFCRDEVKMMTKSEVALWEEKLEKELIPIMTNTKILSFNGCGEFFDSTHSKKFIKKIAEIYPEIKLEIITNGVKISKKNLEKLGIASKIRMIQISLHAATRKTYKKIFRKDNFNKVFENLKYIAELKAQGQIEEFQLMFVINSLNYKDMKKFVKMAQDLGALACFSVTNDGCHTEYTSCDERFAVFDKKHYLYNDFVRIMKDKIFNSENCIIPSYLKELELVPFSQMIKNYIKYLKMCKETGYKHYKS